MLESNRQAEMLNGGVASPSAFSTHIHCAIPSYLSIMDPLLIGRWQASKFTHNGVVSYCKKGEGSLYIIHADGKVEFSYYDNEWITDDARRNIKEQFGRTYITEPWREVGEILKVTQDEMQLGAGWRKGKPNLVFFLKRLPEKA